MKEKYQIDIVKVGFLEVNCYFIYNFEEKDLYIIDPGSNPEKILAKAKEYNYDNLYILLTHAHVDHIHALGEVYNTLEVTLLYMNENEKGLYNSPINSIPPYMGPSENLPEISKNQTPKNFEVIHTPGHTTGGVCYYFKEIPALFSGDTLFAETVGRTDLPGGNHSELIKSIQEKLMILPNDLTVYPGHGAKTSIAHEKQFNEYL